MPVQITIADEDVNPIFALLTIGQIFQHAHTLIPGIYTLSHEDVQAVNSAVCLMAGCKNTAEAKSLGREEFINRGVAGTERARKFGAVLAEAGAKIDMSPEEFAEFKRQVDELKEAGK